MYLFNVLHNVLCMELYDSCTGTWSFRDIFIKFEFTSAISLSPTEKTALSSLSIFLTFSCLWSLSPDKSIEFIPACWF